jgi:hypothetical protein
VVLTVKDIVIRIIAAVGYAAGFRMLRIPCALYCFVRVTDPDGNVYVDPVAMLVKVAPRVPVVMSTGLPNSSTKRTT